MKSRIFRLFLAAVCLISGLAGGIFLNRQLPDAQASALAAPQSEAMALQAGWSVHSYAAKFVCLEPIQSAQYNYMANMPLVHEETSVTIHNPNASAVTFYKRAVKARLEDAPAVPSGNWVAVPLEDKEAIRIDCDDIAKLLTNNPNATFLGTYGIGVEVEGYVDIVVGPAGNAMELDVDAEYVRNSEFMKQSVSYQPWWTWWYGSLPWQLGYPYTRLVSVPMNGGFDCRAALYSQLSAEVYDPMAQSALSVGQDYNPATITMPPSNPALVALVNDCQYINSTQAVVDYVLVSNQYPGITPMWTPGHWQNLTIVTPQNVNIDMDDYLRNYWIYQGMSPIYMSYFYPWWNGTYYWYGDSGGSDSNNIAVGESESIDVEHVEAKDIELTAWPPLP